MRPTGALLRLWGAFYLAIMAKTRAMPGSCIWSALFVTRGVLSPRVRALLTLGIWKEFSGRFIAALAGVAIRCICGENFNPGSSPRWAGVSSGSLVLWRPLGGHRRAGGA